MPTISPIVTLIGQNIDTFIGNARINADFPDRLAEQLEEWKRRSQEAEEDLPTSWQLPAPPTSHKPSPTSSARLLSPSLATSRRAKCLRASSGRVSNYCKTFQAIAACCWRRSLTWPESIKIWPLRVRRTRVLAGSARRSMTRPQPGTGIDAPSLCSTNPRPSLTRSGRSARSGASKVRWRRRKNQTGYHDNQVLSRVSQPRGGTARLELEMVGLILCQMEQRR